MRAGYPFTSKCDTSPKIDKSDDLFYVNLHFLKIESAHKDENDKRVLPSDLSCYLISKVSVVGTQR